MASKEFEEFGLNEWNLNDDYQWEDEFAGEIPADFEVKEEDEFRSVLDITRQKAREQYLLQVKNQPKTSPADDAIPDPRTGVSTSRTEDRRKQRESANQLYQDFLLHKRNEKVRTRLEECREIGFELPMKGKGQQHYSYTEGMDYKKKCRKPRHSFPFGADESGRDFGDGELSSILKPGDMTWEDQEKEEEQGDPQLNYLVEDQYFPGLIDDAIKKKVDFYQVAFDLAFGDDEVPCEEPTKTPITLVEAFDIRVERETGARKKTTVAPLPTAERDENLPLDDKTDSMADQCSSFLKDIPLMINRDEVVLASTVEVDVSQIIRNKPVNDLMKAIASLQRAQLMNEYDKSLQAAEEAFQSAPPELAEKAAVLGARNYKAEQVVKKTAVISDDPSYKPIEIVSYMGITKPAPEPQKAGR